MICVCVLKKALGACSLDGGLSGPIPPHASAMIILVDLETWNVTFSRNGTCESKLLAKWMVGFRIFRIGLDWDDLATDVIYQPHRLLIVLWIKRKRINKNSGLWLTERDRCHPFCISGLCLCEFCCVSNRNLFQHRWQLVFQESNGWKIFQSLHRADSNIILCVALWSNGSLENSALWLLGQLLSFKHLPCWVLGIWHQGSV